MSASAVALLAAGAVAVVLGRAPSPLALRARRRLRRPGDAGGATRPGPGLAGRPRAGAGLNRRGRALAGLVGPGTDPETAGRWWLVATAGVPGLLVLAAGPGAAVVAGAVLLAAPRAAAHLAARRLDDRLDRQVPDALARIAGGLRAGASLGGALAETAGTTPAPLGPQLQAVVAEAARGRPLGPALRRWAEAAPPGAVGVRLAGTALAMGAEAGGGVAQAVDGVAATVRERHLAAAEATSLATQARASAALIGLAPLGFAALLAASDPAAARFLLATPVGLACLVSGLVLEAAGAAWMARITRGVR